MVGSPRRRLRAMWFLVNIIMSHVVFLTYLSDWLESFPVFDWRVLSELGDVDTVCWTACDGDNTTYYCKHVPYQLVLAGLNDQHGLYLRIFVGLWGSCKVGVPSASGAHSRSWSGWYIRLWWPQKAQAKTGSWRSTRYQIWTSKGCIELSNNLAPCGQWCCVTPFFHLSPWVVNSVDPSISSVSWNIFMKRETRRNVSSCSIEGACFRGTSSGRGGGVANSDGTGSCPDFPAFVSTLKTTCFNRTSIERPRGYPSV